MEPHTVRLPADELDRLDSVVSQSDHFDQRSQAIRYAIRVVLQRYARPDTTGFRVQSRPLDRAQADVIADKLDELTGVQTAGWDVVPATGVEE
jgi:Arc/MetJ-type ribon-helix-helix transcriptional regulator